MENLILQQAKIECRDMDMPTQLMSRVLNSVLDSELSLLDNILKQILKRDAGESDYKYISRGFHYKDPMNYDLFFKGIFIGSVIFNFQYPLEHPVPKNLLVITFNPSDK